MVFVSDVPHVFISTAVGELLLEAFEVGDGFELYTVGQVFLFDSEEVPDASSHDLDRAGDEGKEVFVPD